MSQLSVEKKAKAAGLAIEKIGITSIPPVRAGAVFDVSYSAKWMFENGTMQKSFDQLLGAAVRLDDDGNLDSYIFDHRALKIASATAEDFGTFMRDKLLKVGDQHLWGSTSYAPIINLIHGDLFLGKPAPAAVKPAGMFGGLFGKKPEAPKAASAPSNDPAVIFFLTDGDNSDAREAEAAIKACADKPIYFFMVGVGMGTTFPFLQQMADKYDHVGFIAIRDLNISDEAMYASLFTPEFAAFAKKIGGK
ncbi:putative tellurium resistance protein [Caulobacter phage CcrSC]|uniref:Tellurium resistance protein n=1 Tax=Caulobacter phage CcrSC TaxID=2283272 RepID=A0A385EG00_9CAUD|nr:putative tellurium resistance protein [Caulobacter phage CcrSC]AXQ69832.1 putative tellurium resistance protein [Caulobacter phage CcrSC]